METKCFNEYGLPKEYEDVLRSYYFDAIELLGQKMLMFALTSSCGLGQCIPGWSDIDVLIVVDELDFNDLRALHSAQSKYQIKIALALLSRYEMDNCMFDDKTNVVFFQLKERMLFPNYIAPDAGLVFPNVAIEEIQADDECMLPMYLHKLRRALYGSPTDKRSIIKMLYIVVKMRLRSCGHEIIAKSYEEAFSSFAREFDEEYFDVVSEMMSGVVASEAFVAFSRRVVEKICNGKI